MDTDFIYVVKNNNTKLVKLLLKGNYRTAIKALDILAINGDFKTVKYLTENNIPSLNFVMDYIVTKGHTKIIKYFLENNIPCSNDPLFTNHPLNRAAEYGHTEMVKLLLSYGESCSLYASYHSLLNGHYAIVKLLYISGKDYWPQHKLFVEEIAKHDFP